MADKDCGCGLGDKCPDPPHADNTTRLELTVREFLADWRKGDFVLPRLAALDAEAMEAALPVAPPKLGGEHVCEDERVE